MLTWIPTFEVSFEVTLFLLPKEGRGLQGYEI